MEEQDWKDGGGRNTDSILNVRGEMCVEQHHTDMNTRHVDLGVKLRRSEQRFGKGRRGWWRPGGGEMGDFRESSLAKTAECPEVWMEKGPQDLVTRVSSQTWGSSFSGSLSQPQVGEE